MKDSEFISKTVMIENSDEKIFRFLSDFRNLNSLVPPGTENWTSTEDSCSFTLKSQNITLKIIERTEFNLIKIIGDEAFSKKFTFWIQIKKIGDYKSAARIVIKAKLNMIEKAAVKKPLQQGVDILADYLKIIPY